MNDQFRDLAEDVVTSELQDCQTFLNLASTGFNLSTEVKDAMKGRPWNEERELRDIADSLQSVGWKAIYLFDEVMGRLDKSRRGYGSRIAYATHRGMLNDARKRLDSVRRGSRYTIVNPLDAREAGFIAPDDLRPV